MPFAILDPLLAIEALSDRLPVVVLAAISENHEELIIEYDVEAHEAEELANAPKKKFYQRKSTDQPLLDNNDIRAISTGNLHLHMQERSYARIHGQPTDSMNEAASGDGSSDANASSKKAAKAAKKDAKKAADTKLKVVNPLQMDDDDDDV